MSFEYQKSIHTEPGEEVVIFEAYLRERGLKLTKARRDLLNLIFSDHGHFTADDLYDRCRAAGMRVSKATLYRTLTILLDCKLLEDHDFGEGAKFFEHSFGHCHHDHMVCLACRSIIEFRNEDIEALQDHAAEAIDFEPLRHSLTIFGLCSTCQETDKGEAARAEAQRVLDAESGS